MEQGNHIELHDIMSEMQPNTGGSLLAWSKQYPIMLVFLRQLGCTFCRAALAEISKRQAEIEAGGTRIVFVHMSPKQDVVEKYFKYFKIDNPIHISDPTCTYYEAFGLVKGNLNQLFGLQTWISGVKDHLFVKHGVALAGKTLGDGFQMPGVFLIQEGEIKEQYIHRLVSDKPDYVKMAECCRIR